MHQRAADLRQPVNLARFQMDRMAVEAARAEEKKQALAKAAEAAAAQHAREMQEKMKAHAERAARNKEAGQNAGGGFKLRDMSEAAAHREERGGESRKERGESEWRGRGGGDR